MLHIFHKFKIVISERANVTTKLFGTSLGTVVGKRVLKACSCGKIKAFLVDSDGVWYEKLPESVFTESELNAVNNKN